MLILQNVQKRTPPYLHNMIPINFQSFYYRRVTKEIQEIQGEVLFFPSTIIEWNNLGYSSRAGPSIKTFKQNILKFILLGPNKINQERKPSELKLLTRLRLGMSQLRAHKFSHNFSDCFDAKLISNLRTISSANSHHIYPERNPYREN